MPADVVSYSVPPRAFEPILILDSSFFNAEFFNWESPELYCLGVVLQGLRVHLKPRVAVDCQDVVPIEAGSTGLSLGDEPCKRRRDKSAPCKSLQPICTFAPLLRRLRSYGLGRGTTC